MTGRRVAHWELGAVLAATMFVAWLLRPGVGWALAAGAAAAGTAALAYRVRPAAALLVACAGVVAAGALARMSGRIARVERHWEPDSTGVRWQLIEAAGQRLGDDLAAAVAQVRGLAAAAADLADRDRASAFARVEQLARGDGPERGLVVFDQDGRPWAWAGRHRIPPPTGPGLDARITPFYVVLSAGRQGARGGFAVAHVLLSADSAVPDRDATLGARFERATGVGLRFHPPGRGPLGADVFDYCVPACTATGAVPDTLFSVQLEPPGQGPYKLGLLDAGGRWAAAGAAALALTLLVLGGLEARALALAVTAAVLIFTPTGRLLPIGRLFSPATYYTDTLGPVSASAGALLAASVLTFVVGAWLWRGTGRWPHAWLGGVLLALAAPPMLGRLAGGITPPLAGADVGLSVQWQVMVMLAGAALLLTAAALVKRSTRFRAPWWVSALAAGWAVGAALVGVFVWAPETGWPRWYLDLWFPAIGLALLPAPRARTLATLAVVSGTAAGLLTWGAAAAARLLLAERDVAGLRQGSDAIAVGLLERFGARLQEQAMPRNAAELYARWRRTALEADGYPVTLSVWSPDAVRSPRGGPRVRLALAALDVPDSVARRAALAAGGGFSPVVTPVPAVPGTHYALAVPFPDESVVTVVLGPRTRAVTAARVARFLRGERTLSPPYALTLSEPLSPAEAGAVRDPRWRRDGWTARGDVRLDLPEGPRHLHAAVPLGSATGLPVRGLLLLVVDLLVLAALWAGAEGLAGRVEPPRVLREVVGRRSYRARLGVAFAVFFVAPTVGFAAWTAARLTGEARRTRDVVIRQTLLDARGSVREFAAPPGLTAGEQLTDLGARLDAALLLYDGTVLRQSSEPVLAELGVLDWFLPPAVFRALTTGDELDLTWDQRVAGRPTRVGYRRIGGGRDEPVVLGAPRLLDDPALVRDEQDLAFGLILATLAGLAAAAGLATVAARSLAKPVQALRAAAEEVRRGGLPSPFAAAPGEFAPVMAAFERMARDVHASRAALEAQRQRTAAVLRNVATGVLALDDQFRVVTSNPRAEEVLDCALAPDAHVAECLGPEWEPVLTWLRAVAQRREESEPREFAVHDRQVRVQIARLSGAATGWVVALDDVTDLARAVRVLAWGELARQVAHEIKNPLTPIRLGVQHLRRAYETPRGNYPETLDRTSRQILAEIERLDAIARAFSRFGAPPAGSEPLGQVDAVEVARDTAALYALAEGGAVRVVADGPVPARARRDELKEVLINLVENARAARATEIAIEVTRAPGGAAIAVRDDGHGIPADDLSRVFEPQFSTTTSGTGLGLAICKRLVESWGGRIAVESPPGGGTTVRLALVEPAA